MESVGQQYLQGAKPLSNLSVKSNIEQVARQFRGMNKKVVNKAVVTALNKTGAQVKTVIKKEITKATGLKAGNVSKRITTKKANYSRQVFSVRVEGRHFTLGAYKSKPRETKAGVVHSAWGQRQLAKGAFIINGAGGNRLAVKRVKGQKTSTGKSKVKALYGASAPVEYYRADVDKHVNSKIKDKFPKLFATALDFQFRKALKKDRLIGNFVK